MPTTTFIQSALYVLDTNALTGLTFKMLGYRGTGFVLENQETLEFIEVPEEEFYANYTDINEHDHDAACCTAHDTHSSPHKGCIFR